MESPKFEIGLQAYVKAQFFNTTQPAKKLAEKYLGPFNIIAWPGTHSVALELPQHMKAVHPLFHLSMLKPHTLNDIPNHVQPPPPPVEIEDHLEYELEAILDSKIDHRFKSCPLLYFVKWLGYEGTNQEKTWIPGIDLEHAQELVQDFHRAYPDKPGPEWSPLTSKGRTHT